MSFLRSLLRFHPILLAHLIWIDLDSLGFGAVFVLQLICVICHLHLEQKCQLLYQFYPFLLGSPSDVAVNYDDSVLQHDDQTLSWGRKIVRLSLPDEVACRLFVSLVASCYHHFAMYYVVVFSEFISSRCCSFYRLPFLFPNVSNGRVVRLFALLSHPDTYFNLIFFSIVVI